MVLFGHLHVLQQWSLGDVEYAITGNSASKGYVGTEKGNLSGQGLISIAKNKVKYQFIPYRDNIYLTHEKIRDGYLQMCAGEKLHLEVILVDEGAEVNLQQYPAIVKVWKSCQTNIAQVDATGEVYALTPGSKYIHLEIGGKKIRLPLKVRGNWSNNKK